MPVSTSEPLFGHTNVSRPQLQHSTSTHSVTASEDYYSLTSSTYSDESITPAPIKRFTTPPSRYRTPMASREQLPRDQTVASGPMKGPGRRRHSDADRSSYPPNPLQSNPRASGITRKPVPSVVYETNPPSNMQGMTLSSAAKELSREASPPTPGDDDTPYIQFALDQLTRDEEVRGSRVYPGDKSALRRLRDSGDTVRPAYIPAAPTAGEPLPKRRTRAMSAVDSAYVPPSASAKHGHLEPPKPAVLVSGLDEQHIDTRPIARVARNPAEETMHQPLPPKSPARGDSNYRKTQRPAAPETFLAFEPPSGITYLSLSALPTSLRPVPLAIFVLVQALILAALLFSAIQSTTKSRLSAYTLFADSRYFVFQYLPMLLAVILLFWIFQIQIAIYRVTPFIALASDSRAVRAKASLLPLHPSGFFLPSLAHLSCGLPAIAFFLVFSWLSLFAVPLLSASFNVHQFGANWFWLATQGVIWVAIVLYVLLFVSSLWLFIYLWRRQTGLRWDPTSLADLLVILERSNLLDTYVSYFYSSSEYDFKEDVAARGDRLGYWRTSTRPNAAIHTIGAPGFPARQYSMVDGTLLEKRTTHRISNNTIDLESGRPYSYETGRSLLSNRVSRLSVASNSGRIYRPFILRPTVVIPLVVISISLLIGFLVVSYIPSTAIESGFRPLLPIPVNTDGFSAANFLYSFIPSVLGLLFFLLWTHIDMTLRRLQPIANLSQPKGALAEHSLLLSYTSDGPILVTLKALINRDFRVAAVSTIALLSSLLPILGGGAFWAQFYIPTQTVRIYADMIAFHALTVIFAICCLGFLVLPLTSNQANHYYILSPEGSNKLNHANSLVEVIALTHQSRLLADHMFHAPASRIQMVTRLLTGMGTGHLTQLMSNEKRSASKVSLADNIRGFGDARAGQEQAIDDGRYAFGQYLGRDGKLYFGIDRASRIGAQSGGNVEAEKI